MQLTDFEAMSFDCYGTLIDWEAGLSAVLIPWAREQGLDLAGEQLLTEYSGVEAAVEAARPRDRYPDVLARSMRLLGDRLGAEVTDEQAARLARSVPDWPAFPDSRDALAALSKRVKLIILSNVDRASFAGSNARLGVEFTSIITAQDVGQGKLVHVAQSLFHDHVPAKRAGLPTAWINRRHARQGWGATPEPQAPVTPDWEFRSMAAFAAAVESADSR